MLHHAYRSLLTAAALVLATARTASAQQRDTVIPAAARPVAHAPLRNGPIAIDGRLDEAPGPPRR
jgi:hypothetical protein